MLLIDELKKEKNKELGIKEVIPIFANFAENKMWPEILRLLILILQQMCVDMMHTDMREKMRQRNKLYV